LRDKIGGAPKFKGVFIEYQNFVFPPSSHWNLEKLKTKFENKSERNFGVIKCPYELKRLTLGKDSRETMN